jgi:medium-chain acyl-[acyl-carrier-protein] hydrolase
MDKDFAFFGHSVGALVCFELARELQRQKKPLPVHLFVSASRGPRVSETKPLRHLLATADFLNELKRLGGTPRDVLNDLSMMEMFVPVLRADFALSESYEYLPTELLNCSITAFSGQRDGEVRLQDLLEWRKETTERFTHHVFSGDHFFVNAERPEVVKAVERTLNFASVYS